jgi:hypothetical protein
MKTTIFQSVFCILVIATTVLSSCNKEELPVTGSVTGVLSIYDPSVPLVKTPLEKVKIYLINADFKAEPTDPENFRKAILDSTLSDFAGRYSFSNLMLGNYAICPVTDSKNYAFTPLNATRTPVFELFSGNLLHVLNFSAPIPNNENKITDPTFSTIINITNKPVDAYYKIERQILVWLVFSRYEVITVLDNKSNEISFSALWGKIDGFEIITNNFKIYGYNKDGSMYHDCFWIVWPDFINTAGYSVWGIDWSAKTIKWYLRTF